MAEDKPQNDKGKDEAKEAPKLVEETPVETRHEITIGKKTLKYNVTTGKMPLRDKESGEIDAEMFFMAYSLAGTRNVGKRPLAFVFNGGPGSASVWLHMGALGPRRVKMQDEGWLPAPPYQLVTNNDTWIDIADLVFIDPVGTGFSRAANADSNKKYWNLQGDLESVGEFIRLYLTRYERWSSPLFLAGESYGTMRAAGLAGHLAGKGIAFAGIVLISTVLNLQTLRFENGNDLPYHLYLPTYAATAWYHGRLPKDLQKKPLRALLDEVEAWTENEYTVALAKGNRLTGKDREAVIERLARYTGLEVRYIEQSNLRIEIMHFCKELLRDQNITVGRLDSRFKGRGKLAISEYPDFDPAMVALDPPYTAMFNDYVRGELSYETDREYQTLSHEVNSGWEWDRGKFPDTSESLRSAFAKNPFMKLLVGRGYYDLATPHFAARYTLDHMNLDPEVSDNIQIADYEAGHMFYLDVKSLAKLKRDVAAFVKFALKG